MATQKSPGLNISFFLVKKDIRATTAPSTDNGGQSGRQKINRSIPVSIILLEPFDIIPKKLTN